MTVREVASTDSSRSARSRTSTRPLRLMASNQVRRLPVVEEDGRLVGVLAQADVAREARRSRPASSSGTSRSPEQMPNGRRTSRTNREELSQHARRTLRPMRPETLTRRVGAGLSVSPEAAEAAGEAAREAAATLGDAPVDLAFLFLSAEHFAGAEEALAAVGRSSRRRHLLGCVAQGVVARDASSRRGRARRSGRPRCRRPRSRPSTPSRSTPTRASRSPASRTWTTPTSSHCSSTRSPSRRPASSRS